MDDITCLIREQPPPPREGRGSEHFFFVNRAMAGHRYGCYVQRVACRVPEGTVSRTMSIASLALREVQQRSCTLTGVTHGA